MNTALFSICPAAAGNTPDISHLLEAAFGPGRFAKTAYRLREGRPPLARLTRLARCQDGICGSIEYWPVHIGTRPALLLGPLAVHPKHQSQGIGQALLKAGQEGARAGGHELVFLVGDEAYYSRAGFAAVPRGRVTMPGPVDYARRLYAELKPGAMDGASGLMTPEQA
jgi:predicted N-acetyltransferase YhbS